MLHCWSERHASQVWIFAKGMIVYFCEKLFFCGNIESKRIMIGRFCQFIWDTLCDISVPASLQVANFVERCKCTASKSRKNSKGWRGDVQLRGHWAWSGAILAEDRCAQSREGVLRRRNTKSSVMDMRLFDAAYKTLWQHFPLFTENRIGATLCICNAQTIFEATFSKFCTFLRLETSGSGTNTVPMRGFIVFWTW